jgi:hypothetical protein
MGRKAVAGLMPILLLTFLASAGALPTKKRREKIRIKLRINLKRNLRICTL